MITFVRRLHILNRHYSEGMELLKARLEYMQKHHGISIELKTRFGGPVGEVALVSHHADAGELELFRRKLMSDLGSDALLESLAHVILPGEIHDEIWMS